MLIFVLGIQFAWAVCESIASSKYRATHERAIPLGKPAAPFLPVLTGFVAAALAVWVTVFGIWIPVVFTWKVSVAIAMAGVGIALRFFSIRTLGSSFRDSIDLAPAQVRIVTGPYRFLRHPAEIGFLLLMTSLTVVVPGIGSISLLLVLAGLCGYRMWLEDRLFRDVW